jgi:hypothetical protein
VIEIHYLNLKVSIIAFPKSLVFISVTSLQISTPYEISPEKSFNLFLILSKVGFLLSSHINNISSFKFF